MNKYQDADKKERLLLIEELESMKLNPSKRWIKDTEPYIEEVAWNEIIEELILYLKGYYR